MADLVTIQPIRAPSGVDAGTRRAFEQANAAIQALATALNQVGGTQTAIGGLAVTHYVTVTAADATTFKLGVVS